MMRYPKRVNIVEVGPRDGLQNETTPVAVATRVELIRRLTAAGLRHIEVGALVSPKWVPQMADSVEVYKALSAKTDVHYPLLVPNDRGLEDALAAGVKEIAIFAAASDTFSLKNINCSIKESLSRYQSVAQRALDEGLRVRGYVSCIAGCPYEGEVPVGKVVEVGQALTDMGCYEVSFGDTIGVGTPLLISSMLSAIEKQIPIERVGIHCHDTYGMAIANIHVALQMGVAVIDSAVAGLGGCPYAPGASGNVATEEVLYLCQGLGIDTGVDLAQVIQAGAFINEQLGITTRSRVAQAHTHAAITIDSTQHNPS